jgi:hypothetical protein
VTTVRFRYTKWFRVTAGSACLHDGPDGWLQIAVRSPGTIVLDASFSLAAATGNIDQCN